MQGGQHAGKGENRRMENLGKFIVGVGAVIVVIGLVVWLAADKLNWFGRLPGDIAVERPGWRLYAPITTMLLLSVGLSLLMWLYSKFFR
jgi:H+/Cl- antiporter ClcA